ncbi:Der GTPase-activating protein YihI [Shewanella benthica]|uniref:Der GTPase-activating protein YihI n=1 Tax=Shewanella benthica TaxID=43661 RepID=A0A330LWM3_9GAMM|nr:Der GTPase-activating protein YihI [Shewanella benthica]SQH74646.1 Der GTPase-activating protein YihI [Shewanella benthica]
MSHSKKSRKANENAPKLAPRTKKSDRGLAGKKNKSGNKAGSRHNSNIVGGKDGSAASKKDPRHGSKKAIKLDLPSQIQVQVKVIAPKKEQGPKLTDEQKLFKLEEDPRLNQLLDMLEEGKDLSQDEQKWINKTLNQIEALMERLGITEEDDLGQVIESAAAVSDDDLLDRFESGADLLKDYQNKD